MDYLLRIRWYLTQEVAVLAALVVFISGCLDHCISLFRGLSCFRQKKLQSIQNTLVRIVTNHRKYDHVTNQDLLFHYEESIVSNNLMYVSFFVVGDLQK